MITSKTRAYIKAYLEGFIQGMIDAHKTFIAKSRKSKPTKKFSQTRDINHFQEIDEFERFPELGTTFEEVAKLIGKDNYAQTDRGYKISGVVSKGAVRTIESIIDKMGGGMNRSYLDLISQVVDASKGTGETRWRIADLYVSDKRGNEIFFEIKSPKPNKGQCLEATDRLLQIHAMKQVGPPKVRTYYAMAYNPYGINKNNYTHSFTCRYMDLKNQVLIGKEFWDLIGGNGTYEEVLEIYREVGREKGHDMIDQLALDY